MLHCRRYAECSGPGIAPPYLRNRAASVGTWGLAHRLQLIETGAEKAKTRLNQRVFVLVAGVGFEPTTFGL